MPVTYSKPVSTKRHAPSTTWWEELVVVELLATIIFNATEVGNGTLDLYDTMLGNSQVQ
jgi:hypothetical protein